MQDKYAVINHVERRFVDPESDALATSKVTLFLCAIRTSMAEIQATDMNGDHFVGRVTRPCTATDRSR